MSGPWEQFQEDSSGPWTRFRETAKEAPSIAARVLGAAVEPNLSLLSGMAAAPISGLAGIAGSVMPGPQGQGAEWTKNVGDALSYAPRSEAGKIATEAISYPFRKLGEGADFAGEKVADWTGSPAAGAGVNSAIQVGVPLGIAKVASVAKPSETLTGKMAERLMQSAVKPTLPDLQSGNAQRAIATMLEEGINPTSGGMDKLRGITGKLNEQVKEAIANSQETVNVVDVGSRLRDPYSRLRAQVNPTSDLNAIRQVWDEFRNHPDIVGKTDIPVQLAQQLKTGTYRNLGNKSYGEVGTASTEGQKALARGLREEVAAKVPDVVEPLKREASLMNVLSVAERRAIMEANKNPMGLSLLANNPYAWAGFMADKSALFKSIVARMLYEGSRKGVSQTELTGAMVNQEKQ